MFVFNVFLKEFFYSGFSKRFLVIILRIFIYLSFKFFVYLLFFEKKFYIYLFILWCFLFCFVVFLLIIKFNLLIYLIRFREVFCYIDMYIICIYFLE